MSDQKQNESTDDVEEKVEEQTDETTDETTDASSSDDAVDGEVVEATEVVVLEDAEGTEVVEDPAYATPNADVSDTNEEETEPESKFATPNAVSSLLNLESLINGYIVDIEKLQEKSKTQREMLNDAINNDAEFSQIMAKVKEVTRVKSAAKQRIMKLPNVVEMANKMREYKEEMKDIQEGLSQYLQQYVQLSGANQITSDNGEVRQIVNVTKLVKKRV